MVRDLHSLLLVEIGGRTATRDAERKQMIDSAALVVVGDDFDDEFPGLTIVVDGRRETLRGSSDDPRLWRLYDAFLAACARGISRPDRSRSRAETRGSEASHA